MRFWIIGIVLGILFCLCSCPEGNGDDGVQATEVAESMSRGTVGDADIESGELPGEAEEEEAEEDLMEDDT